MKEKVVPNFIGIAPFLAMSDKIVNTIDSGDNHTLIKIYGGETTT